MADINPLDWQSLLDEAISLSQQVVDNYQPQLNVEEIGTVTYVGRGIARAKGLLNVQSEELVEFPDHRLGIAYSLEPDEIGIILLDDREGLQAGCQVWRTERFLDAPVGTQLLGRVIDATGCPLDNLGTISTLEHLPVARDAPGIMQRAPVTVPLQTGIKVIDALIPIGRGQRELIIGDRATGKTALAIDTIINQKDQDVICIYCAIGQGRSAVAKLVAQLRQREALKYSIVVVAQSDATPGLQYITPYAATTMAEYFLSQGQDVLIVYDDLMQHARAYRQLSLLLRFPPGREAFPGDIFELHSRLLERATHLRPEFGGGSLTALPIVETEEQNISAYIPINLVSITDGQIYLTSSLFDQGILPAIDVSRSVSRLGRQAQLPAYRQVAEELRLSYFQFEELKKFSHLGSSLGAAAQKNMRRGERIEELLKQIPVQPVPVAEQIIVLLAVTQGIFDLVAIDQVVRLETAIRQAVRNQFQDVCRQIEVGETLSSGDRPQSIGESAESMFSASSLHQVLISLAQEVKDNLI